MAVTLVLRDRLRTSLSPVTDDPTTAVHALDRRHDALRRLDVVLADTLESARADWRSPLPAQRDGLDASEARAFPNALDRGYEYEAHAAPGSGR
jgi:hypothetical protein